MEPEIVIVREERGYRLLHGLLWLTGTLSESACAWVDVPHEGRLAVVKTSDGIRIRKHSEYLPLYLD